ncbi:MAG TPA: tRNA (N(6)-L-threonylcarbamoyladenosine(37)-C(2))-methylthiotransferase MtaB [Candidatus Brocadiia bacterium]|nr:tRNA (N(6)-L-threonylcarbamoyladenosine(37)-C(2))-methylthiotransferase MtaB [Candidatus Brocadiia bacterium]
MCPKGACAVYTLGCKVSQYDGQVLREMLAAEGITPAAQDVEPSVCLVNSCAVTARAEQKCRQLVRRLARKHPGAKVIVTGCYAARAADELSSMSEVSAVIQPGDTEALRAILGIPAAVHEYSADHVLWGVANFHGHARAFLKIQDGCDGTCSYCIVPSVRPRLQSRPLTEVVDEARRLIDNGFREIVLTGVRLGKYGRNLDSGDSLADAVEAMERLDGLDRFRLSSLEPMEVSPEFLDRAAACSKLCRHLHLPLQSGSDATLARMNRPYDSSFFLDLLALVRDRLPGLAISADVIAGFPGETDSDHARTMEVCGKAGFCRMHVFPFSPRPGTKAELMQPRVLPEVIKARVADLTRLGCQTADAFRASLVGRRLRVLFERQVADPAETSVLEGYSDEYQRVRASCPADLIGRAALVVAERLDGDALIGRLCGAMTACGNPA